MFNFLNSLRTKNVHIQPQLMLDMERLAHANNPTMQLHFDRMQTALDAQK